MNIDEMSDQEKNVLLAKAMGWAYLDSSHVLDNNNEWIATDNFDLYDPANMALAWRVHLWACSGYKYLSWWKNEHPWTYDNAQRLFLDKILTLAIEAGLVEVTE